MSLYIVRPKTSLVERFPALATRHLTAERRKEQLQEVAQLWLENRTYQAIHEWIEDAQDWDVTPVLTNHPYPTLTGATLVEMPDDEAQRMRREVSNITIVKDRPIELIPPIKKAKTAKETLTSTDIWHLPAIHRPKSKRTGKKIKIAVFDTGIDSTHPETRGKVAESYYLDSRQGTVNRSPHGDTEGHGTHVAGLLCGRTVGVAPDAQLISVAMIPGGVGQLSNFVLALEWIVNRPDVPIVNISAGMIGYKEPMDVLINDLLAFGILPICAVGNEGRNASRSPGNCRGVVSVGATNRENQIAGFSGSGTLSVERHQYNVPSLVAPGTAVYSSIRGGGYEAWDGTSMATPIVSGVAALILEEDPTIPADDLREALLSCCQRLDQPVERQGQGMIQVRV